MMRRTVVLALSALSAVALSAILLASCGGGGGTKCNLSGGTALSTAAPWARFHADLANTGRAKAALAGSDTPVGDTFATCGQSGSRCKWRVATGAGVSASAAIDSDGSIYIGSSDTHMYGLLPDGTFKWKFCDGGDNDFDACQTDADCPGDPAGTCVPGFQTLGAITSTPAIDTDSRLFFGSGDMSLYTLSTETGEALVPRVILTGFLVSSVTLASTAPNVGVVYVGSPVSGLFGSCPNGVLQFTSGLGPVRSAPAVGPDGTVYYTTTSTRLLASIDPDNGFTNWTFTGRAGVNSAPVLADDGKLYFGDTSGAMFAVGPDGTGLASIDLGPGSIEATPAIGFDGTIFVATTQGRIFALDPNTLAINDTFSLAGDVPVVSSPAVTMDGTVVFGSDSGTVYALQYADNTFSVRWTFNTAGAVRSSPAIGSDGTIVVGSDDRNIYALNP